MGKERGIVLITSLVLAAVLVMFVTAALNLAPGSMQAGQASLHSLEAKRAAQSGIDYALAQFRLDPTWRGDRNAITVNSADLVVREDQGNVSGLVRSRDGSWSQFRFRFNFQDGPGGLDNLDDPALPMENEFVSVSNLAGAGPAGVPRADGPGYAVTPASPTAFQVPTWSVSLAVEGTSALVGVDPSAPEVAYSGRGRRQIVEAVYQIPPAALSFVEAGAMAGQSFTAQIGPGAVNVTSSAPAPPRMRVKKGTVAVAGGGGPNNYLSTSGEIRTPTSTVGAGTSPDGSVSIIEEEVDDKFYELAWADVKKADSTADTQLKGGTYVRWQDGSLHYYDMGYDDYVAFIQAHPTDPGKPFDLPSTISNVPGTPPATKKLVITGDVAVVPGDSGTSELNVITRMGAPEFPPDDPEAPGGEGVDVSWAKSWLNAEALPPADQLQIMSQTRFNGQPGHMVVVNPAGAVLQATWDGNSGFVVNNTGVEYPEAMWALLNPDAANAAGWSAVVAGCYGTLNVPTVAAWTGLPLPSPGKNGEINPPSVSDNLTASDLEVEFAPPAGQSAVLSAEGNLRLTGSITGKGGTITSGGEIKIVGLGASLASQDNPVNLYAVGDITFSSLDEAVGGSGNYSYKGVDLKGIVYTQGSFRARLGSTLMSPDTWGNLSITGMLIAFGGQPGVDEPGTLGGDIEVRARNATFDYNTGNAGALANAPPAGFKMQRISWSDRF